MSGLVIYIKNELAIAQLWSISDVLCADMKGNLYEADLSLFAKAAQQVDSFT